ncbi:MAG: 23S rRNA (uracil(1939)-C(5))-methyltransferase RlmD, partial [Clostridiales bacterium]|nr:23S rRNA (uracil(1939)-C(5))-methyltransferase RlmD [Clostridiales bacterium]
AVDVLGVKAELSPLSFFQVNDEIRDTLYIAAIGEVEADTLIDLYNGIGITSNLAARKCKKIVAVECVPQAVKDADRTAEINGNSDIIKNVCGKVEEVLSELKGEISGADVLIDPPRKGCGADVAASIASVRPNKLIYISCNHATMCRDIRAFLDVAPDYELTDCRIFDMFPNTHHTEVLCVLCKKR